MTAVLDDARLHTFVGGSPADEAQLRRSYQRRVRGRSEDGREVWLNWVVRDAETGDALGYVQATVTVPDEDGDDATVAHLAWVVGIGYQRQRVASRAAVAMGDWVRAEGVTTHIADIHPEHTASQRLARRLGMHPTGGLVDGEVRWSNADGQPA